MRRSLKPILLVSFLMALSTISLRTDCVYAQDGEAKRKENKITPGALSSSQQNQMNAPSDDSQFYPIEKIRPGMRAIGYTVVVGKEPKAFECEVLGVMKSFPAPQQSAVIVKLLGSEMAHTGVFQGMSGSPVYIDNKLVGAVAFGYMFSKDPIAGITPIRHMIDVFEQKSGNDSQKSDVLHPRSVSFSELVVNENSPVYKDFNSRINNASGSNGGMVSTTGAPPSQVLTPIATPLAISGISPDIIERFSPLFRSWGFAPVAGVASAAEMSQLKKADSNTLKPGSTVVVPLVRGDFSLAAAGTVTYRDGNKIYAFGHPFLQLGVSEFPMHEGEVITVMSSSATSFKIAEPTAMVGTMRGDRSPGILGELGSVPRMIPVEINVRTSRGESRKYNYDVVTDKFLTPLLLNMTVLSTITSTERTLGDSTLKLFGKVKLKGREDIVLENRVSLSLNAPLAAALTLSQPLTILFNSGFKDMEFEKVTFDISSVDTRNTGQLERLWISRSEVRRGEKLEIQAFARADNGAEYVERISIEIPEDAPLGQLQITVGDGKALQAGEIKTGFTPKSLDQLIKEINKIRKSDRMYVKLSRAESGVVIKNEEMPSLPPSVLATLGSDRTAGGYALTRSAVIYEKELPPAEFVISGQKNLTINVVNK